MWQVPCPRLFLENWQFTRSVAKSAVRNWAKCRKMNTLSLNVLGRTLISRPHVLLVLHLLILHVLSFGGIQSSALRLLWPVGVGFFLLWQPFVSESYRLSWRSGGLLVAGVVISTAYLGAWLLLVWCGALAAAIGGRVIGQEGRRERAGYLLAFGYLSALTVLGAVPELSPAIRVDVELRHALSQFLPLTLLGLFFFPAHPNTTHRSEVFDLFYGVVLFLVLASLTTGALAYVLVSGAGYIESLIRTSLTVAGALLLLAWVWNPSAGLAGTGAAVSRYLLSLGMPFETWLKQLSDESEKEAQAGAFLAAIMRRFTAISWVAGVVWSDCCGEPRIGGLSRFVQLYQMDEISVRVYFRQQPSPALVWHVEWLLRLAFEVYLVKRQSEELQSLGYMQAIYETGARVTHDVKNLLQSLQVLCYTLDQPGDQGEIAALIARQLPQITERLRVTLGKLVSPRHDDGGWVEGAVWWDALKSRYAHQEIIWCLDAPLPATLPGALFDHAADNLLQNALSKRIRSADLQIVVKLEKDSLLVEDDGEPVSEAVLKLLVRSPLPSETGVGVGLYQIARQARLNGYRLELSENRMGAVRFSLLPA